MEYINHCYDIYYDKLKQILMNHDDILINSNNQSDIIDFMKLKIDTIISDNASYSEILIDDSYIIINFKNQFVTDGIVYEEDEYEAVIWLYNMYMDGKISNPTYNLIKAEYGLPDYNDDMDSVNKFDPTNFYEPLGPDNMTDKIFKNLMAREGKSWP